MSITLPSRDFADTVAAGFVESDEAWAARTQIPDDWAERLCLACCWSLVVTATHAAEVEARIRAELRVTDRLVTFLGSGLTAQHIATALAASCLLLLAGRHLWETSHA